MSYTVYAIVSLNKKYIYVGMTNNLCCRIKEHNNGRSRATSSHKPFRLIYQKQFTNRIQAREHEKQMKSGYKKEALKLLLNCDNSSLN
jgi:putative endonuclease